MIKVLKKNAKGFQFLSPLDFKREMGVQWRDRLSFRDLAYERKVYKRASYAMRKRELSLQESWLGVRFSPEIERGVHPLFSICYIDLILGYGVFAEEEIPKGGYIGEYTGVIRKRRWRSDKENDYCFEYTIGDWVHNPFIIDAKEEGNMTRYMNHSEEPNVRSLSVFAQSLMHIIFVAEKSIEPGDQLCYHYGDTFWKKRQRAVKIAL